jgi:hypothetical protein
MEGKTYAEKLKDPRWQKKRLEIFERDKWTCQRCGGESKTLCVHHLAYHGEPWEAPDSELVTMCEDCHEAETALRKKYEDELLGELRRRGFSYLDLSMLSIGIREMNTQTHLFVLCSLITFFLTTPIVQDTVGLLSRHPVPVDGCGKEG